MSWKAVVIWWGLFLLLPTAGALGMKSWVEQSQGAGADQGASATGDYDNAYCYDPVELQRWEQILADNPGSDAADAIHALWVGLCAKVEARQITTLRANRIFDDMRNAILGVASEREWRRERDGEI